MTTAVALFVLLTTLAWTFRSQVIFRRFPIRVSSLRSAISMSAIGNLVVAGVGLAALALVVEDWPYASVHAGNHPWVGLAAGAALCVPGSRFVASAVGRDVAEVELAIARLPATDRLATLAVVPFSEELLWRAALVAALSHLGLPIGVAVGFVAVISVAAHATMLGFGQLMQAVVPSAVGTSVAFLLGGFWVAVVVHVFADVEILVRPEA